MTTLLARSSAAQVPAVDPSAVLSLADADADAAAVALHDGALQALVVARYAADAAVRGGDAVLARDAVQEALVALRRAVWLLRPRGEQGLLQALRDLSTQLAADGRPALVLDVDDDALEASATVSTEVASAAYRLVQHAAGQRPTTVQVRVALGGLLLDLDAPVPDPGAEALRARAVGADLLTTAESACLRLPFPPPASPPLLHEDTR